MLNIFKKNKGIQTFSHPVRYLYQINKLIANAKSKGLSALFELTQQDVPLFNFSFDADNLANAIAVDIRKERYHLTTPRQRLIETKNKKRIIYDYPLTDKIVIGVIAQVMNELLEQVMSDKSYAFRVGSSPLHVVKDFTTYIKSKQKHSNIREFYIFRTDFVAYSDEIDVRQNSIFWKNLDELFNLFAIRPSFYQLQLIKEVIRPEFYNLEGHLQSNLSGVPTGTSMITFINNFYAYKIDNVIGADNEIFYARYCDDILICHTDKDYLKNVGKKLLEMIDAISLKTNAKKDFWGYFTPAGKASDDPLFEGTNMYDYLGYRIHAHGTFSLSTARQNKFLQIIHRRIKNISRSARFKTPFHKGKIICNSINDSLIKTYVGEQSALSMIRESSDHGQLKHLDYQIALRIAENLSGLKGPKAFRKYSYEYIRKTLGLRSLITLRNERTA